MGIEDEKIQPDRPTEGPDQRLVSDEVAATSDALKQVVPNETPTEYPTLNSFSNPGLLRELETLTAEDKELIESQAATLAADIERVAKPLLHLRTKKNGKKLERVMEHAGVVLKGEKGELQQVSDSIIENMIAADPDLLPVALWSNADLMKQPVIKVLQCPDDCLLLQMYAKVPVGHSLADKRGVGFTCNMKIPTDASVLTLLESKEKTYLLPHIIRSAALLVNPNSQEWVDAPIGASNGIRGENTHVYTVVDTRRNEVYKADDATEPRSKILCSGDREKFQQTTESLRVRREPLMRQTEEPVYGIFRRWKQVGTNTKREELSWNDVTAEDIQANFASIS